MRKLLLEQLHLHWSGMVGEGIQLSEKNCSSDLIVWCGILSRANGIFKGMIP